MKFPWTKKIEEPKQKIQELSGKEICRLYYTLNRYYDAISTNIGIIKDKKKFDFQIKTYKEKLNLLRGDKMIVADENKCTFIIGGKELTFILINDLSDFEKYNLYFRKYI